MSCALCVLGFKKDGKVRKLERYITALNSNVCIDITTYRIRIEMLRDDLPGRDTARCIYVCGN